ncbi:MAG TPA: DUF1801 domain-containing protein [Bacteroidia bacterium]|nr:DUF1801 domain-containing protein [Bacteroidia bacterium]
MSIPEYIKTQSPDRQKLLKQIHETILKVDKSVTAEIEPMMGKEMIIYKCDTFKYALGSVKEHMSLHLLPIYMCPDIHAKYKALLKKASFQKGCVNFKAADEMPMDIVKALVADCAKVDLKAIREKQLKSKGRKS